MKMSREFFSKAAILTLSLAALGSFVLVFHNYALPILPRWTTVLALEKITAPFPNAPHVFAYSTRHSEPNLPNVNRSALVLMEDGKPYSTALPDPKELMTVGGVRFVHEPNRILFSTRYNSDPRINGHTYSLSSPVLYSRSVGHMALLVLGLSIVGLHLLTRGASSRTQQIPWAPSLCWRWHLAGAALMFTVGLYCNTGTLSPYAITTFPHQSETTGYLYNPDHAHFRALFDFVDGADRQAWDEAILLRRILYPLLAWPMMKTSGFEIGGTIASLLLNLGGFVWAGFWLRRRIGDRGAVFALWLLAFYPGAAYWAGMPYPYALISPLSMLLALALETLAEAKGSRLIGASLAMGVGYLAYDFAVFFLPASMLLLLWHRRPVAAGVSTLLQILPLALWLLILAHCFGQSPENSNTRTYTAIIGAYQQAGLGHLFSHTRELIEISATVFFGANFIFLPAFFVCMFMLNPLTSRLEFSRAEICLLLVVAGVFVFNQLAPDYGGWQMRGAWISRLYQPVYPIFILFAAKWWQKSPALVWPLRWVARMALAGYVVGNSLIIFGPILGNPGRVSETAFYRFYRHTDHHWVYEQHSLKLYGRRPLGFPVSRPLQ